MEIVYNLTLDLVNHGLVMICAKQGDNNTRFVWATLTSNGAAFNPASAGATASFRCRKPDGNGCYNPATINEDGAVIVELTQQVLAVPGTVMADICLHGSNDEILSTASFVIRVEAAPNGNNVTSSNEFLELEQLINSAKNPVEPSDPAPTFDPTTIANLHVWRRAGTQGSGGYAPSGELETAYTLVRDSSSVSPVTRFQGQYADAVAVTDGVLSLVDPVSIPTVYADRDSVIPGKYITAKCKDDGTTYIYLVPTGDAYSSLSGTTTYATGQVGSWVRAYRMVETAEDTGDAVYVCAESADAYSGSGYEYLGRLGDAFESGGAPEDDVLVVQISMESGTASMTRTEIDAARSADRFIVAVCDLFPGVPFQYEDNVTVDDAAYARFIHVQVFEEYVSNLWLLVDDVGAVTHKSVEMNGSSALPPYTEADYGKFLSPSAEGLVWVELADAEDHTF